jgi:mannan endo-1,4-beta-mannosidase
VGEFGPFAVYQCPLYPFDYSALLKLSQSHEISWLAWSWGGIRNRDCPGLFDMTSDGRYENLFGWGLAVMRTDAFSLEKTAKRSSFLRTGSCSPSSQLSTIDHVP